MVGAATGGVRSPSVVSPGFPPSWSGLSGPGTCGLSESA